MSEKPVKTIYNISKIEGSNHIFQIHEGIEYNISDLDIRVNGEEIVSGENVSISISDGVLNIDSKPPTP